MATFLLLLSKSSAAIALAFLAALLLRRASAALRHRIWTTIFVVMLAFLVLPVPRPLRIRISSGKPPVKYEHPPTRTERLWTAANVPPATTVLLWLWRAGALISLAYFTVQRVQLSGISRRSRLAGEALAAELTKMAVEARVSRPVALLVSDDVAVPLTWGIFNARIVLPGACTAWPATRLSNVLRHELAHVERLDVLWQLLADVVCVIYWFNPLVWRAAMKIRMEREVACDEAVISGAASPAEYAADVSALATDVGVASIRRAGVAMAGCPRFPARVQAISSPRRAPRLAFASVFLIAVVALPLAAFQVAQTGQQKTFPVPEKHVQDFQYAVTAGWYDQMVKMAIADPSLINSRAREGQTPLYLAATSWSRLGIAEARWLIEHGADVNAPVSGLMGETALIVSVRNPEMIKLLLDHGADIDAADTRGRTALDEALVYRGAWNYLSTRDKARDESVKILLDHGAKLSFISAVRMPHVDTVRKYLTDDPSLARKTFSGAFGKQTALTYALAARNLDHDAYQPVVDVISSFIPEPTLCEAAMLGRTDLVAKYLDAEPAKIKRSKDGYYADPLSCAILANERGTVLYLLNRGAKPDEISLHSALVTDADTVRLLLSAGAAKELDDKSFEAFAKQAEARGKKDIAEVLRAQAK